MRTNAAGGTRFGLVMQGLGSDYPAAGGWVLTGPTVRQPQLIRLLITLINRAFLSRRATRSRRQLGSARFKRRLVSHCTATHFSASVLLLACYRHNHNGRWSAKNKTQDTSAEDQRCSSVVRHQSTTAENCGASSGINPGPRHMQTARARRQVSSAANLCDQGVLYLRRDAGPGRVPTGPDLRALQPSSRCVPRLHQGLDQV